MSRAARALRAGAPALAALLALARPLAAPAQEPPPETAAAAARHQENRAFVQRAYEEHLRAYRGRPDMLVRPGLLANRAERWIRLTAEATALAPTDPVEFFLIAESSGHGYESAAIAFAKPSDVHDALEFIGVPAGRPASTRALRLWPKGERVLMTFEWDMPTGAGDAKPVHQQVRAERLIVSRDFGGPLPETGLAFVGSSRVASPENPTGTAYAADAWEPNSIAANYNESTTVLDVPRQAEKGAVYGSQTMNPDFRFERGQRIEVRIVPEYPAGRRRVMDLDLSANAPPATATIALADARFDLDEPGATNALRRARLADVLAFLSQAVDAGRDPFVTLRPSPYLPLRAVSELCRVLAAAEGERGIRIEPPPTGQPYFRAFLPPEKFRERANRPIQPWELILETTSGGVTGRLNRIEEKWAPDADQPSLDVRVFDASTPQAVRRTLTDQQGPPIVLIFAPDAMTYGTLLTFLSPILDTHPTVYVFLPPGKATDNQPVAR